MNKIDELKNKIKKVKAQASHPLESNTSLSPLLNIAVELLAGGIVGVILGLILDKVFASKPLFLIICIIMSITAAFRTIWKKNIK